MGDTDIGRVWMNALQTGGRPGEVTTAEAESMLAQARGSGGGFSLGELRAAIRIRQGLGTFGGGDFTGNNMGKVDWMIDQMATALGPEGRDLVLRELHRPVRTPTPHPPGP